MAIICVSGATGNVGGACARYLLSQGAKVRCLVRDADSEKSLALKALGAELAPGDFANAESLSAALKGTVAAMLACSNQPEQVALETNFIRAVESSSTCKYLVKLSTCGCPGYCAADSAIEYGRWHAAIEAALEATDSLTWTILQPNDFMQNHAGDIFGSLPHKALAYPRTSEQMMSGCARIVDTRDVGEIAAKLLLLDEAERGAHSGKRYHVCGPASWSIHALAVLYEAALSLPAGSIACKEGMSEAAFADHLETNAGFPRWLAVAVAHNHMFWAEGKLDYASSEPVLQLHPIFRTMEAWVQEHAPLVRFS